VRTTACGKNEGRHAQPRARRSKVFPQLVLSRLTAMAQMETDALIFEEKHGRDMDLRQR